ncbi:MAG: arylsulfatase, partial [bacterium]|nr:arylsulfatase [bacterium]
GYADLGCYGSKALETPRIDRMAAEGMRFTDAYSGCTVCAPARSTLMTGKHMGHAVLRGNTGGISMPASETTVAEVLKTQGYATGGFGKWGLGDINTEGVPEKNGFDLFYGYYHQIHAHYYYPGYLIRNGRKETLPGNANGKRKDYSHYLIFEEAKRFIRENRDTPFFCYCPWTPPHGRYEIPEDEPAWLKYKDKKGWGKNAKVAAAMDEMLDRHVGEVLDLLKELDIDDNTIVFFCSDNGASERFEGELDSCGPLRGRKRAMSEGGIRVPMIARWPGRVQAGSVSDLPWYFPDVMPTFAELAGADTPDEIDGVSVAPTLLGQGDQQKHECLYWEWPSYNWRKKEY